MKIFLKADGVNSVIKIIKTQQINDFDVDVTTHVFSLRLPNLNKKEILYFSDTSCVSSEEAYLSVSEDYLEIGNYRETSLAEYKLKQARLIGMRLISILLYRTGLTDNDINSVLDYYTKNQNLHTITELQWAKENGFNFIKYPHKQPSIPSTPTSAKTAPFPNQGLIDKIYYDEGKKTVAVRFKDGETIVKECHPEDHFDLNVGVALAIIKKIYKTTTNFKKYVSRKAVKVSNPPKAKKPKKEEETKPAAKKTKKKKNEQEASSR